MGKSLVLWCITAALLLSLHLAFANTSTSASKRILMVVSSHGIDQGETQPGFEFDEYAKAYLVFDANGFDIDVASPKGGKVEADKYDPDKDFNQALARNPEALVKLNNTLPTHSLNPESYDAVFIVGGKGAMFDLPKDTALQTLIARIYEDKGTVSAVCHGPAALVDVTLSNGDYLVAGKAVNGFTNQEEKAFGKKWVAHFDFMLEDKLKARGGNFEHAPLMLSHVAQDGNLITGQNPFSTTLAAQAVVRSLGIEPVAMPSFKDDRTIALVADILAQDPAALARFAANPQDYQPELMAMYGYYLLQNTEITEEVAGAVTILEATTEHMPHPQLQLALAQGYQRLHKRQQAERVLQALVTEQPQLDAAQRMLSELQQQ